MRIVEYDEYFDSRRFFFIDCINYATGNHLTQIETRLEELLQEGFVINLNMVILSQYVENVYLYGDGFTVGDTFNHINNVYINGNLQE